MSLALEQPRLVPVQPWGCPGAADNSGTLWPSLEKTSCSFPFHPNTNDGRRVQSEIQNYIAEAGAEFIRVPGQLKLDDADMVSCCIHAFVLSICRRSSCVDGGIRIKLQMQRQI